MTFHKFKPCRCDWCDAEIPTVDAEWPEAETHGHLEFFNDVGTRGNRRNLCLKCFNKLCCYGNRQPKMVWLNQEIKKLVKKEKGKRPLDGDKVNKNSRRLHQ